MTHLSILYVQGLAHVCTSNDAIDHSLRSLHGLKPFEDTRLQYKLNRTAVL